METFKEPLTKEEEAFLLDCLKSGDMKARNQLVEHNLRLVAHIAKKYNQGDYECDEMISIGTIGLIKAVNTFQADKGSRLATYASKCIENEILMYLRSEKKKNREVSMYESIGTDKEGNCIRLLDVMEAESLDFAAKFDTTHELKWLFHHMEQILTPSEFYLIKKRYGLFGEKEMTQRELAKTLGISRSYVSRIEKKCLAKLKNALCQK